MRSDVSSRNRCLRTSCSSSTARSRLPACKGGSLSARCPALCPFENSLDQRRDLIGEQRWYRVSDLAVLMSARTAEVVIVRECLQTRRFAHRETATLRFVIVNEIVPVLRNVTCDGRGRTPGHLNPETIVEMTLLQGGP